MVICIALTAFVLLNGCGQREGLDNVLNASNTAEGETHFDDMKVSKNAIQATFNQAIPSENPSQRWGGNQSGNDSSSGGD